MVVGIVVGFLAAVAAGLIVVYLRRRPKFSSYDSSNAVMTQSTQPGMAIGATFEFDSSATCGDSTFSVVATFGLLDVWQNLPMGNPPFIE
jgi:hypothetical protein